MRPKDRNDIQHPAPSKASAYTFTENTITTRTEQKAAIESVIRVGTRINANGEEIDLFIYDSDSEPSPQHSSTTRQREDDDDRPDVKRQRIEV